MERVELHSAAWFTCPDCGQDTFVRLVAVEDPDIHEELRQEAREHIAEKMGCDPAEIGFIEDHDDCFVELPTRVVCVHCGVQLDVECPEEESNEDDSRDS